MKKHLLLWLLISIAGNLSAQFTTEQELIDRIKENKTDAGLNKFLLDNGLIYKDSDTSKYFHAKTLKTNIFYKNLFGDTAKEVILEIQDGRAYSINVFYYKATELKKTRGNVTTYFENRSGYGEQSFEFKYENIFKENEYCIVTQYHFEYIRTVTDIVSIYKVTPDTIQALYSFHPNGSTYSGILRYIYSSETLYEFKLLRNKYPKILIIETVFRNEVAERRNDNGDILSGYKSTGSILETIIFNDEGAKPDKVIKKEKIDIFQDSFNELLDRSKIDCDTNITIHITDGFLMTYLKDTSEMPELKIKEGNTGYFQCCNAYINDRTLFVSFKDSITGKVKTSQYPLRPPLSVIFREEINPKRLYYFTENVYNYANTFSDTLIYFNKDTTFSEEERNVINLGDPSLLYNVYWYFDREILLDIYGDRGFRIALERITPYLKPDILELFRKIVNYYTVFL